MQAAAHDAQAQGAFLMRAPVVHGEKAILPPKHSNLVASRADDAEAPLFEILCGSDVNDQVTFSPTAAGFASSSAFHP